MGEWRLLNGHSTGTILKFEAPAGASPREIDSSVTCHKDLLRAIGSRGLDGYQAARKKPYTDTAKARELSLLFLSLLL